MDPDTGEPQDELLAQTKQAVADLGSQCTKVSEIVEQKDEAVFKAIQDGLDRANEHAVSRAQRVRSTKCGVSFVTLIPGHFYEGLVCSFLKVLIIASVFMQVQKFTLLDKDFSVPGGELGEFDAYRDNGKYRHTVQPYMGDRSTPPFDCD